MRGLNLFDLAFVAPKSLPTPQGTAWANRVVTNGGTMPSASTILASQVFYNSINTAGLLTKIKALNFYAPDNLIAAITPLIKGTGLDPWTNSAFVSGDLTVNGLAGNGSTKFLTTGIIPTTVFPNNTNGGLTVYCFTNTNFAGIEIGTSDGGTGTFWLGNFSGTTYWDCVGQVGGRISIANAGFTGYLSGNRTAANNTKIYKANSLTPHTTLQSGITAANANYFGASVLVHKAANFGTSNRISFAAIHDGFTITESANFFNAIQVLRTSLGGGYI